MDTLRIDSLATSFNGLTAVGRRGVYFLDELFCWLYRLDAAGKPQTRLLGQGRSNREVPVKRIDGYAVLALQQFLIGMADCLKNPFTLPIVIHNKIPSFSRYCFNLARLRNKLAFTLFSAIEN